MYSRVFNMLSK